MKPLEVSEADAPKFLTWLQERGGLSVWSSKDLGGPPSTVTTPYRNNEGEVNCAPHWRYGKTPDRHITEASDVEVYVDTQVDAFGVRTKKRAGECVLVEAHEKQLKNALAFRGEDAYAVFTDSSWPGEQKEFRPFSGCDTCTIMKTTTRVRLPLWEAHRKYA
jgi:hypothetical protein